jgi:AcrR family transcriptional regulator
MGRWEPDAVGRLREAAMELYLERGFEQTTVAEIASRAGLTARTFFRYFADKREVLFGGSTALQDDMVAAVVAAPDDATPLAAVELALDAAAEMLGGRRDYSRQRHAVISANGELQERELIKMAMLSIAMADALRGRGVPTAEASLAAETGVAVFRVGWERWITEPKNRKLETIFGETFDQLRTMTS